MASITPDPITYTELCFPDITGKTIRAHVLVTFTGGAYVSGGIPANLLKFADVRTVDFNGFLRAEFYGENPYNQVSGVGAYTFYYSPVTDTLQIFRTTTGVELTAGAALPAGILSDTVLAEITWDRTTTR